MLAQMTHRFQRCFLSADTITQQGVLPVGTEVECWAGDSNGHLCSRLGVTETLEHNTFVVPLNELDIQHNPLKLYMIQREDGTLIGRAYLNREDLENDFSGFHPELGDRIVSIDLEG